MIQSVLLFTLGFLCAGFLALMAAPAIWRRAVALTRHRIEASVPLTLNEIQADKDRMRAEFAMSTRRLEMSVKSFRDKANTQVAEIGRNREELKHLGGEIDEKNAVISDLEARASQLRKELDHRQMQLEDTQERLQGVQARLEARALELERERERADELSLTSSNRQIELVSRETEIERLSADIETIRAARRDNESALRKAETDARAAREALDTELRKSDKTERKLERLMATLSDREDKLDRREKELARLREDLKALRSTSDASSRAATAAEQDKLRLEGDLAAMALQMQTLLEGATGHEMEKAVSLLKDNGKRVEKALKDAEKENRGLKRDLKAQERARNDDWDDQKRQNALLREQINDLAAEVVRLTATLEGPQSPIHAALAPAAADPSTASDGRVISLADRVRALQDAARERAE
ncbi:MAG: hypothetical protein KDJ73_06510 [Notoacmeibacter sp.]|nr:hypothetical protein [Notoacmeibacter sp.]